MHKFALCVTSILAASATALAEDLIPPLKSSKRILWTMACAGPMPDLLLRSLVVICLLAMLSILCYRKVRGKHGR